MYTLRVHPAGPKRHLENGPIFFRLPASNQAAQSGRASRIKNRACHTWSVQVSKQSGSYECTNTPPLVTQTEARPRPVLPNIVNCYALEGQLEVSLANKKGHHEESLYRTSWHVCETPRDPTTSKLQVPIITAVWRRYELSWLSSSSLIYGVTRGTHGKPSSTNFRMSLPPEITHRAKHFGQQGTSFTLRMVCLNT